MLQSNLLTALLFALVSPLQTQDEVQIRTLGQTEVTQLTADESLTSSEPLGLPAGGELNLDEVLLYLPDPADRAHLRNEMLEEGRTSVEDRFLERLTERVAVVDRPEDLRLALDDVLQRAMRYNYNVRVSSYNPAIDTARIVEAEAAFDASFFANLTKNKQNQPTASALVGSNVDTLSMQAGLTKLLPSGMRATTSLGAQRQSNDFQFQEINPVWTSDFVVELRQPWLRGFGIDFNRSAIRLAKLDRDISESTFRRQIITTLRDVEQAYWTLVQARREVVISASVLTRFEQIYDYLWQRREFDAYRIQIADTRARLEQSRAAYIQVVANVRNAEDRLIALINDPDVDLADNIEILPTDFPQIYPVAVDRETEAQVALDHRPELHESKYRIKQARVRIGQAKNQVLPQLDMTFRYTVDGLGKSAHRAFSEVTKNDFHEYFVSIEFEIPVGNRAARARLRQAQLQHAQAIASLESVFENVLLDVNLRVRGVETSYDQIAPNFETATANKEQFEAIRARAESRNFVQLNQELNALQSFAVARRDLMQSLIDYNMAIVELERAKGTLPEYNNIVLTAEEQD